MLNDFIKFGEYFAYIKANENVPAISTINYIAWGKVEFDPNYFKKLSEPLLNLSKCLFNFTKKKKYNFEKNKNYLPEMINFT